MTLKFCMKVGLTLIHRPLLVFASPVHGFCAMNFLPVSYKPGRGIETRHWPVPCFWKIVNKEKIESHANFQPSRMCTSQVRAFRIMLIIRYQYMSTGWLVTAPMTLKFCMKVGLTLIHRPLLVFASPVHGFCAMNFLSVSHKPGRGIETRHWPVSCFWKMVDKKKIESHANFQPARACTT
jgi:hypothetical protein